MEGGAFSQALRFAPDQAGTYFLEVFAGPEGGLLDLVGRFGPVQVAARTAATAVAQEPVLPRQFSLGPAYPNPFNSSTFLPLEIPAGGVWGVFLSGSGGRAFRGPERNFIALMGKIATFPR